MLKLNENDRLGALRAYNIIGTEPETEFDELTHLAASICSAPISKINLVYKDKQWAKSLYGLDESHRTIPLNRSISQYAIQEDSIFEIPNLSKDSRFKDLPFVKGEPFLKYYLAAQLVTPDGYKIGTLCVQDYREQQMPDKKKKQLKILAHQVIAHLELRKHNIELANLNRHNVALMKILSHDLRSPLSGIIGMSGLLKEMIPPEDEETIEMVSILNQSAQQLNQLINDILNYTVIESKGFTLHAKEADIQSVVNNLKQLYMPSARLKNIELNFNVDTFEDSIQIDQEKFEQIFGNLLSNAIKFTKSGGKIESSLIVKTIDGIKNLVLTVSDNGIGMEKDALESLFTQDMRNNKQGTSGEKSTGLGLSIIKHFTELHNGHINVDSTPEKGTRFTISLPIEHNNTGAA